MKKSTILLAVVVMSILVGCSTPSVPETESQFCQDLAAVPVALDQLGAITASSTIDDLKTAQAEVDAAMTAVQASAVDMPEVKLDNINAAYATLTDTVTGIPDDATLAVAAGSVVDASAGVRAAYEELNNVSCAVDAETE